MPTKLAELIQGLPVRLHRGSGDTEIRAIVEDSRAASKGCLFVARPGTSTDGRAYVDDAVAAGAVAVLADIEIGAPPGVAVLTSSDVPAHAAALAERWHGRPSSELDLVGVTGTNGKTTTCHLIHGILNGAARRCGLIGTVRVDDGLAVMAADLTTPPAMELSRLLRDMVRAECRCCVMEASSHALDQGRTAGLSYAGAVFTNFSGDHLDYHGTMEAYLAAKGRLFESLPADGWAILNGDDPVCEHVAARCRGEVSRTSLVDRGAPFFADVQRSTIDGVEARFFGPWGVLPVRLPLVGLHNVANALQAAAVCSRLGLDAEALRAGLEHGTPPPGRLERVDAGDLGFTILVDFAHSDDALQNVLRSIRPLVPAAGRLRVVFGCGGDRDRSKRPRMARVAWRYADDVVITSDNPRTEDPLAILDEVFAGVPEERRRDTSRLVDRAAAIRTVIERADPGDVVLIAGKGHEDYQIIGRTKRPFDDRLVAAVAVRDVQTRLERT